MGVLKGWGGGGASQATVSALGYFKATFEDMREIYRILVIKVKECKNYYSVLNTWTISKTVLKLLKRKFVSKPTPP
jgi:hypothetical protein